MNAIYTLITAGIFVATGDIALAYWARTGQIPGLLLGLLLNIAGILFYARTLNQENISIATALFLGFNILMVTIASILLFNERISLARTFGLLVLTGSIILIEAVK